MMNFALIDAAWHCYDILAYFTWPQLPDTIWWNINLDLTSNITITITSHLPHHHAMFQNWEYHTTFHYLFFRHWEMGYFVSYWEDKCIMFIHVNTFTSFYASVCYLFYKINWTWGHSPKMACLDNLDKVQQGIVLTYHFVS